MLQLLKYNNMYLPLTVHKLFQSKPSLDCVRNLCLSPINCVKTIVEKQEGNTLVIEGVIGPSPREQLLVKSTPESKACPLCRLNLNVKHTDVLILSQFVRSDGCMLPKRITGLCSVQQKRVGYMVTMAHKAGLMGKFKPATSKCDPKKRKDWKKFNIYFDETTIKPPNLFLHMKYKNKENEFLKSKGECTPKVIEDNTKAKY